MIKPRYTHLSSIEFDKRIEAAYDLMESCVLCPHKCSINRKAGIIGRCRAGLNPVISSANIHNGEEPPISGDRGSGTIFFTNCNLRCCFCQNYPISQLGNGREVSPQEFAGMMMRLQKSGAHNINFVTPTPWTPQIIAGIKLAAEGGLRIPIVYNTSGYDSMEQLRLLDGIVDIYLPDMKYADDEIANKLSGARGYTKINEAAIREMYRQAGELQLDQSGIAVRGLIIRHMVLPNNLAGTQKILEFIATEISPHTHISLMGQYFPAYKAFDYPEISRRINSQEYEQAVKWLHEYNLENGWIQDEKF